MKFVLREAKKVGIPTGMDDQISVGVDRKNYNFKLKEWIAISEKYPVEELDPQVFAEEIKGVRVREGPIADEQRIQQADLSYPIIIVKHAGGSNIVDGTHRIRKAMRLGVPVKARVIPFQDLASFKRGKK